MTNLVTTELPARPLRSLGELQHFDINYYNPFPPYVANAIGNSAATFAIDPDKVFADEGAPEDKRTGFDHSFVANHLLFDDWFVSSLAPDVINGRSLEEVYRDFLAGEQGLGNRFYRPEKLLSLDDAEEMAKERLEDSNGWSEIASQIEVEGMFNVNSTSVAAWAALLKHLKNAKVPQIKLEEDGWTTEVSEHEEHPVVRTDG